MQFTEHIFRSEGVKTRYLRGGDGPLLLFLHGGGLEARTYRVILGFLARSYSVVAPDLPGFGRSTMPKERWGLAEYARFFEAFIARLNLRQLVVMGHSLGGGIALHLAANTDAVSRLIIVDSAGIPSNYSAAMFRYELYVKETFADLFLHRKHVFTWLRIVKDFTVNRLRRLFYWGHIMAIVRVSLSSHFIRFDRVKCPVLVLWGNEDDIFPPNHADYFGIMLKNVEVKRVTGDHDWLLYAPREFAEIVTAWLERVRQSL